MAGDVKGEVGGVMGTASDHSLNKPSVVMSQPMTAAVTITISINLFVF